MWRAVAANAAHRVVVALQRAVTVRAAGNLFNNSFIQIIVVVIVVFVRNCKRMATTSTLQPALCGLCVQRNSIMVARPLSLLAWLGPARRGAAWLVFKASSISIFRFGHEVFYYFCHFFHQFPHVIFFPLLILFLLRKIAFEVFAVVVEKKKLILMFRH